MALMDVANELVAGCRDGTSSQKLDDLYAPDAVSVESADFSGMGRESKGLDAIKGKHAWWEGAFEYLGGSVSDPYPHGDDRFAVMFEMKIKNKETGEVEEMSEIAVYHVAGDKIVREEFFYPTGA